MGADRPDDRADEFQETALGSVIYDAMCDMQMIRRDPRESVEAAEYIAEKIVRALQGDPR